jgi:hypothetical protein
VQPLPSFTHHSLLRSLIFSLGSPAVEPERIKRKIEEERNRKEGKNRRKK